MKRYDEGHRGMLERIDGEWVLYADHCEAMKRIAAEAQAEWVYRDEMGHEIYPADGGERIALLASRETAERIVRIHNGSGIRSAALTPPRQMVADSAGGSDCTTCGGFVHVHDATGEYRGECPHCALTFEMWFDETSGFTKHDEAVARAAWNAAKNATLTKRTMSFAEATDLWNRITNYSDSAATHFITRFANALLAAQPPAAAEAEKRDTEQSNKQGE